MPEDSKERPRETRSREYRALGEVLFEGLCKAHGLTDFQIGQLDKFMKATAGVPSSDPRYIEALTLLMRTQLDKQPMIGAMHSINIVYAELFSPHNPRARGKRGYN